MKVSTTSQRLKEISVSLCDLRELGSPSLKELESWVIQEFGSLTVLDFFERRGERSVRAVAPEVILLIGAGNLIISLWQGVLVGLVLGSRLWVKPASGSERELRLFVNKLSKPLRDKIEILVQVTPEIVRIADVVVALGKDETLEMIQKMMHPKQRFIGYGQRVSVIWIGKRPHRSVVFDQIVRDVTAYDQQGCLSPRWIWVDASLEIESFAYNLGKGLDRWGSELREQREQAPLTLSEEAMIYELRETHRALGDEVLTSKESLLWTVIIDRKGRAELTTLPRVIFVRSISEQKLSREFSWMSGELSTVGLYGSASLMLEALWIRWGVSRICRVGEMQTPPLYWLHDGRPQISDLVRWVEKESS